MSKYVYPQTARQSENYMDAGGNGNTRTVSVNKGGLELRDYFAAMAMQGFCTDNGYNSMESIARDAYTLADAMIKQRGKNDN